MGFKRVRTLGDVVRYGLVLRITCTACGRAREVPASALYPRFRANVTLVEVGAKLKCSGSDLERLGCGHVGATVDFIIPDPPSPPDDNGGGNVVAIVGRLYGRESFWDHAGAQKRRRRG